MFGVCAHLFSYFKLSLSHDFHAVHIEVLTPADIDEYNHMICLPNTRLDVIKDVMEWIANDSDDRKKVLWVHGVAGSGRVLFQP